MEMMRNPNAMREMMRSQDLAMSQLENLPGGFNALRNMFEEVHEPMMEAANNQQQQMSSDNNNNNSNSSNNNPTGGPVNSAVPNPWGAAPATTNPAAANNPWGMMNPGAGGGANPFGAMGGGMGGMGGLGGMGGAGMDPAQAMAMLQNPFMQQMMQQMLNDQACGNQMAAENPMMAQMLQNPQTRAMLTNPEMLRRMSDPAVLQASLQMQQSMQTLQRAGVMPGGLGGIPGGAGGSGLNFEALFNPAAAGGAGTSTGTGAGGFGAFGTPVPPAPVVDPATRYASQIQQLRDMGFADDAANIRALQSTSGNVHAAVERLLGGI
jgi:ubiquilin